MIYDVIYSLLVSIGKLALFNNCKDLLYLEVTFSNKAFAEYLIKTFRRIQL